ncbi:hypothetical protein [Breznakia pachnodae]|uniref:BLOC-1-related complex subunit 7 n=1 Tax=Breznakia pachnodae TaxID=265178 RepID=A0ABU0DZ39_9FIRM|nr:hypothetical protein [Breznakia pachnodae]MDQ0359897.1 hypothetical protein [Breznakia pachnodae]
MGKELAIKTKICTDTLSKMKNIQDSVSSITEFDCNDLLRESSGDSVNELKAMVQEMYTLKATIYNHMTELTESIENYINDHIELDKTMVSSLRSHTKK